MIKLPSIRNASRGSGLVQTAGMILVFLMVATLGVDGGLYFAAQNQLQTAADSAALAATDELYASDGETAEDRMDDARDAASGLADANIGGLTLEGDDIDFGFIDPATKIYDPETFGDASGDSEYEDTNGYNAVRVAVRRTADSPNGAFGAMFARLVGIDQMNAAAFSVALADQVGFSSVDDGGLRPIYVCQGQFDAATADGNMENDDVRIYGSHVSVNGVTTFTGCPAPTSGNWGFADLRDCHSGSVGSSTIAEWFENGYPGQVEAGQCYSTKPGNFISSISPELDQLIADETVIMVPLYDSFGGTGSNTNVTISGFAGFVITGYVQNGASSGRYISGRFTKAFCNSGCTEDEDADTTGAAMIKLRLAARN